MRVLLASLLLTSVATASLVRGSAIPRTVPVTITNAQAFTLLATSNRSSLYQVNQTDAGAGAYATAPYVVDLFGTRFQIGYDYAELLGEQTSYTLETFMHAVSRDSKKIDTLMTFMDYLWNTYYLKHVPQVFVEELNGMQYWCEANPVRCANLTTAPHVVSRRFFALANMPADAPNIIAGMERELERGWPAWLKELVNAIIKILENNVHSCDAYGVWGSRTENGRLYTSRNLDYASNTGINKYKLVQIYNIIDENATTLKQYAAFGFTFGMGALAGQSKAGITTSEMNLDNSEVTFSGLPFPLRLRYILENAVDLESAMTLWNSTNNTNSFNFMIGSAKDGQAYALETIYNFTAVFPADSPIEAAATYDCGEPPKLDPTCRGWVWNQTHGRVPIGSPIKEAVWRTNHGFNPRVMATQEPLFNNTVFRYRLMHSLFTGYQAAGVAIGDAEAVGIVATLGTKGNDYYVCNHKGENVMSIAYVPAEGRTFIAWEEGSGAQWQPAGCAPYVHLNLSRWWK